MELTVTELATGGDAVAIAERRGERRAVFLRGALPEERVQVSVDFSQRPARGHLLAVLEPASERAPPACEHATRCGGCDWMHLAEIAQSRVHVEHLTRALPPAWRSHPVTLVRPTSSLGYRSRARLHLRSSGGRAIVGVHEARSHEPVEVDRCVVLHPSLERARAALGPLFEGTHGRGDIQLALGAINEPRPAVLSMRFDGSMPPVVFGRIEAAMKDGVLAGAHLLLGESVRPTIIGDPTPWIAGGDAAPLRLAAGGFAQASDEGNVALGKRVSELAQGVLASDARVVELYAGAGNFTVLLARHTKHLVAVESHAEACKAAEINLRERGLSARVQPGDAAAFVVPKGTRLVVLDPPRTGARAVCEQLAQAPVPHLLYVSCDLATLSRDLTILATAYEPRVVEAFELFPQTSHVEAVVLLERLPFAARGARS